MKSCAVTDSEDTQDSTAAKPTPVGRPIAGGDIFRSPSASRSPVDRNPSRASTPASDGVAADDMLGTEDVLAFDFEESMNTKRKTMADKAAEVEGRLESDKEAVRTEEMEQGKKPFVNGIDMFADVLNIDAENTNVSRLMMLIKADFQMLFCQPFW